MEDMVEEEIESYKRLLEPTGRGAEEITLSAISCRGESWTYKHWWSTWARSGVGPQKMHWQPWITPTKLWPSCCLARTSVQEKLPGYISASSSCCPLKSLIKLIALPYRQLSTPLKMRPSQASLCIALPIPPTSFCVHTALGLPSALPSTRRIPRSWIYRDGCLEVWSLHLTLRALTSGVCCVTGGRRQHWPETDVPVSDPATTVPPDRVLPWWLADWRPELRNTAPLGAHEADIGEPPSICKKLLTISEIKMFPQHANILPFPPQSCLYHGEHLKNLVLTEVGLENY